VADRTTRQAVLISIYEWTKALGEARLAARALVSQRDSIKADLVARGKPDAAAQSDSLNARIARASTSIDRAFTAVNNQRGPIEGWSGVPTADQRKALGYAIEDSRKAIADLNKLVMADIPSAYAGSWPRKVNPVKTPISAGGIKDMK